MSPRTLVGWEERLRSEIEGVDLLGEIRLTCEESLEIGRLIGALVGRLGWQEAERTLEEKYPCSFAVHLVSRGVHGYVEGNYWDAVRESTGLPLPPAQTIRWGRLFETIVQRLEVAQFPDLGGHRFVGPILAHGGIPDYCLDDFFERFIRPLVSRPEYAALSAVEFLAERLNLSSISSLADRPVLRFLRYGGEVAEDFVERCRELALRAAKEGVSPAPEVVGLPRRVVEAYSEWLKGKARVSPSRRRAFRSPVLFLDPWGWGVCIYCPSQSILATDAQVRVLWRIWADGELEEEVPVEIRQEEFDLKSEGESILLHRPAQEYWVALVFVREDGEDLREEIQREWRLPGVSRGRPLLIFDRETKRAVVVEETIPASSFWVLCPPEVELVAEPAGSLILREGLPRLPWGWSDFVGEAIDLSQVSRLGVVQGGAQVAWFSVVDIGAAAQPTLEGGRLMDIDDGRPPLYAGSAPMVRIPSLTPDSRLHRWHIEVRNEWPARPSVHISQPLDTLRDELNFHEGSALFDLSRHFGQAPMGNYRIAVRGHLGRRADLSLRILPYLEVAGHETLYLPGTLPQRATLLVETSTDCTLQVQRSAKGCEVRVVEEDESGRLYEVTADPEVGNVPLRFVSTNEAGEPVYVSLTVPLRRLRWMIVLRPEEASAPQWRTAPVLLPLQALEQSLEPYVFLDLFGGTLEGLSVELHLEDEEGSPIQEQTAQYKTGQRYVRFDLRPFLDTLRHTEASRFTLRFFLRGLPDHPEPFGTPVTWITKRFVVRQASAEAVWDAESVGVTLRWEAVTRARHRLARLWPLWRPWEPPLEVQIPDEARGEHRFTVPACRLTPGKYLLEFDVRDPWAATPSAPSRPAIDAGGVFPVYVSSNAPEQRLDHLARLEAQGALSFADVLERACILHELDRDEETRAQFQWCLEHLDDADAEHLLALSRLLYDRGGKDAGYDLSERFFEILDDYTKAYCVSWWAFGMLISLMGEDGLKDMRLHQPDVRALGMLISLVWEDGKTRYEQCLELAERVHPTISHMVGMMYNLRVLGQQMNMMEVDLLNRAREENPFSGVLDEDTVGRLLAVIRRLSSIHWLIISLRFRVAVLHRVKRLLQAYQAGELSEAYLQQYLDLLPQSSLLPIETVELLLNVGDERVCVDAALTLLERNQISGYVSIMRWLIDDELSVESVLRIFVVVGKLLFNGPYQMKQPHRLSGYLRKRVFLGEDLALVYLTAVAWVKLRRPHARQEDLEEWSLPSIKYVLPRYLVPQLAFQKHLGECELTKAVVEWVKRGVLSQDILDRLLGGRGLVATPELCGVLDGVVEEDSPGVFNRWHLDKGPAIFISPGCWVRSVAGWGRIERIETPQGEEVSQFPYRQQGYRLYTLLRAQEPAESESVTIDLAQGTVTFREAGIVYTCAKCRWFSSTEDHRITDRHEHAAHEGIEPRLLKERGAVLRQREPPEYSFLPPEDPWG